jgi:hypothetical protein
MRLEGSFLGGGSLLESFEASVGEKMVVVSVTVLQLEGRRDGLCNVRHEKLDHIYFIIFFYD